MSDSCGHEHSKKRDYFFLVNLGVAALLYLLHLLNSQLFHLEAKLWHLPHIFFDLFNTMSWGLALGIFFMGVLGKVKREYIFSVVGNPGSRGSLMRATAAGLLLDLCSHGILMVGMKLYQRGASLGQVMAFLIASPWNSLSLTLVLVALIGIKYTLLFIILSGVIAIISGCIFELLVKSGVLPDNPNSANFDSNFSVRDNFKSDLAGVDWSAKMFFDMLVDGLKESRMILRWLFFGALLSTFITYFVDTSTFQEYFGPNLLGLGLTLFFATIIEVCSEGATPIGADLVNRAGALGNGFTFLMAGVATDYTEIMSIKETAKSWKIALFLPLVTVPQVLLLGWILNKFSV